MLSVKIPLRCTLKIYTELKDAEGYLTVYYKGGVQVLDTINTAHMMAKLLALEGERTEARGGQSHSYAPLITE